MIGDYRGVRPHRGGTAKKILLGLLVATALLLTNCAAPAYNAADTAAPTPAATNRAATAAPTAKPQVTKDWSDTASTSTELSFSFPGDWFGAARLPFGEGLYVKDPDRDIGVIFEIGLESDPEALLTAWGREPIDITGLLSFIPSQYQASGDITVSRQTAATRTATDGQLTARCACLQRDGDVMRIVWFAPTDQWDAFTETFDGVLASVEIWNKLTIEPFNVMTMKLHDWQEQADTVEGGQILQSLDGSCALTVWTRDLADPVALLGQWKPDILADWGFTDVTDPVTGDRFSGLGGDWEAVTGTCVNAGGVETTYAVSFLPNQDRVLEIVLYAPTCEWERMWPIFKVMLSMLSDLRG